MITLEQQRIMFADHSLNMDTMKIKLPNGELVSSIMFNRMHIGEVFECEGKRTRSAYRAYVKNQPVMYWSEPKNIPNDCPRK